MILLRNKLNSVPKRKKEYQSIVVQRTALGRERRVSCDHVDDYQRMTGSLQLASRLCAAFQFTALVNGRRRQVSPKGLSISSAKSISASFVSIHADYKALPSLMPGFCRENPCISRGKTDHLHGGMITEHSAPSLALMTAHDSSLWQLLLPHQIMNKIRLEGMKPFVGVVTGLNGHHADSQDGIRKTEKKIVQGVTRHWHSISSSTRCVGG